MALKKAYADIILNTAKEAAARVMASERKALSFENDLHYTKDEAHRMLLRFKHMFDAKVVSLFAHFPFLLLCFWLKILWALGFRFCLFVGVFVQLCGLILDDFWGCAFCFLQVNRFKFDLPLIQILLVKSWNATTFCLFFIVIFCNF